MLTKKDKELIAAATKAISDVLGWQVKSDPKAFLGALLLCGWILCIRAASTSLGSLGFALCALVLGTLIWMLTDIGILHDEAPSFAIWAGLVVLGLILGVGLSWSLIRERATGTVEVD